MTTSATHSHPLYTEAIETLRKLLAEARAAGDPEPTAMNLATVSADGRVSSRIVLLKHLDQDGLQFFTNYESDKAEQLAAHAQVAVAFHWKTLRDQVQVRVEGRVEKLDTASSDAYFSSRPRMSQIGAWASLQSRELPAREVFDARVAEFEQRFEGADVPRPPNWGGYRLRPDLFEFWYGANFRLHDRQRYELDDGVWNRRLLFP
ncbi:MAG TPA: pyridoxamine 5'-phosphate oxidase [Dokdonella sp.]|uniref:pyridoxamine 5'-phosphate oxidase n=1 Tax=Dokdonella sp. TaxID=2291710 RepID=UPI002D801840|nr:pyridoxamine 5'-phosphate oxidase [Dokdonella sp.]HET9032168.1 pyridoxamine 5'-phosphate oxidase [Dokdonella sp.]